MGGIAITAMIGFFMSILAIFIAVMAAIIIYATMNYVFESIFLYRICNRRGASHKFLAWIPFLNKIKLGKIAGRPKTGIVILILDLISLASAIGAYIMFEKESPYEEYLLWLMIGTFLAVFVLNLYLSHHIMKKVMPRWTDLLTLVNVFTAGLSRSIILFLIRNRKELLVQDPDAVDSQNSDAVKA